MARRNWKKFPAELVFQLNPEELETLKAQKIFPKAGTRGGRQKLPLAYTQIGVSMMACVLKNDHAFKIGLVAFRAFSQSHSGSDRYSEIESRLSQLEKQVQEIQSKIGT